jgi:hydrogenase-4 component F
MELLLIVLSIPLAGGVTLALIGHRDYAPEVNALFSLGTLVAAIFLTLQVIEGGPLFVWN